MTGMTALEHKAILAAKQQNWTEAIEVNQLILNELPENVPAMIRMGVAYAQLQEKDKAKELFERALVADKSNMLAKKHLLKLANNQSITLSSLPADEEFIEEPGKTRTVELHRLASKEQMEKFSVGQKCTFKPKGRFISVEIDKVYIGSIPEDLSARLTKLINTGNEYICYIRSLTPTSCTIFIKEAKRSKANLYIHSFPVQKSQLSSLNDIAFSDDAVPLQMEDIPIQIVETDADDEKTPDMEPMEEQMEELPEEPEND